MPVTAPEFGRRAFLLGLSLPLFAGPHQEVLDVLTALASALSEGNGLAFLDFVDHSMPEYEKLQRNIQALASQNEVLSAIDVLDETGDDQKQAVEVDWVLQIRSREQSGPLVRRRQTIKVVLERAKKKKWKVVSLDPVDFFAPRA
ncbi:MAG TPA: hypothetical protein VLX58_06175 [Bryobacteraceae bacterium]|nr:hypothetical protein [Bryobacteraceae bacterium]